MVMVFVNKAVLNSSPTLPFSFIFIQLLIAVVLLHLAALISPTNVEIPNVWDLQKARQLFIIVAVSVVTLVFNTLCLRDVDASFFQIARGMVLPLTIVVSALATCSLPSAKVLAAALVVTLGFLIGVSASTSSAILESSTESASYIAARGVIFGFISSFMTALHAVLIKSTLPAVNNSSIQLAYWTNAGAALFLIPLVVLNGELTALAELVKADSWVVFAIGSIVTGIFGFFLCIATLISIKVTSPVTHMFAAAARSVLQTLLGVWIFGDIVTSNRALSIVITLAGTLYFTWVKAQEARAPPASRTPESSGDPEEAPMLDEKSRSAEPESPSVPRKAED
ncbi:hypothetical protein BOTBODRAFT_33585 [Botryobasidium botryosum FD-172 SS1]|uniref:GDP-mannose transporter n=1 Tax=Botryobasidium botryosum (strain FD-172 SS1) TaxID=930990 RepID=A0A067MDD6_BOTB1|nr:hypothetical protein BOTBODRAFT_33585 [Botryobasidium botryosum FD-172 SS1]